MRKIIVGAQVSMDGVMQAPGGPTEDPTKGFKFGGWAMPYFDQEAGEEIDRGHRAPRRGIAGQAAGREQRRAMHPVGRAGLRRELCVSVRSAGRLPA